MDFERKWGKSARETSASASTRSAKHPLQDTQQHAKICRGTYNCSWLWARSLPPQHWGLLPGLGVSFAAQLPWPSWPGPEPAAGPGDDQAVADPGHCPQPSLVCLTRSAEWGRLEGRHCPAGPEALDFTRWEWWHKQIRHTQNLKSTWIAQRRRKWMAVGI